MPVAGLPAIPGYTLLEIVGSGGMGIVYKARQDRLDRLVALKVMRAEHLDNPTLVERFQREARAVARLSHPHIVALYDADETAGTHFLVMEYVEGIDLGRLVAERGPLPLDVAALFLYQAALALQHAHGHSLVHRDIKPSNIVVASESAAVASEKAAVASGEGLVASKEWLAGSPSLATSHSPPAPTTPTAKLLDFGLARFREPASSSASVTTADQLVGTPDFMAPEQIADPRSADIRSDLYSLGCTFYYALTGRVPFPGGAAIETLDGHRWKTAPPAEKWRPDVTPELAGLIHRLMRKQPGERFVTPGALLAELEPLLGRDRSRLPGPTLSGAATVSLRQGKTLAQAAPPAAEPWRLGNHADWVTSVAFSPDGTRLASASRDGVVRLWDAMTGAELRSWNFGVPVAGVAFLARGRQLLAACADGVLRRWRVAAEGEPHCLAGHEGPIHTLAVTPDNSWALTGGEDQTLQLWNLHTGRSRLIGGMVTERHWDAVLSAAISSDGELAVSGSRDQTVRLWELAGNREIRVLPRQAGAVNAVAFVPETPHVLTACDQALLVWQRETGELLKVLEGHEKPIRSIAVAADGRRAVTASEDRTLRVWDLVRGKMEASFEGHRSWVLHVTLAPDGARIATGSADCGVLLWRMLPGEQSVAGGEMRDYPIS